MTDPYNRPDGGLDPQTRNSYNKNKRFEPLERNRQIDDSEDIKETLKWLIEDEISKLKDDDKALKGALTKRLNDLMRMDWDWLCSIPLDSEYEDIHSISKALYELLLGVLASIEITAVPDLLGDYAGFKMYSSKKLKDVDGLLVPEDFRLLDKLPTSQQNRISKMLSAGIYAYLRFGKYRHNWHAFTLLKEQWGKFIEPIVTPKVNFRNSKLFGQIDREFCSMNSGSQFDERIAPNLDIFPHEINHKNHPLKVVPAANWFPKKVRQLKPEQIVAIFQPTELKVFMLLIGRALIGADGTEFVGYKGFPIHHTHRTAAILKGVPGTGKSEILNILARTMGVFGYSAQPFRSLDDKFGLGPVAEANLAYRDDSSASDIQSITQSSTFKSFVVGNHICAEKKFRDSTYIKARGIVILAANDWDANLSYSTDSGNRSRLRLLETLETSVRDLKLRDLPKNHPWYGLDSLSPFNLICHLSEKLEMSEAVIMGWFYRKCADLFYESIPKLESIDRHLESKLTTRISASPVKGFVKSLKLTLVLMGLDYTQALTRDNLSSALFGLNRLLLDCRSYPLLEKLKERWEACYRSQEHCWTCFRDLRYESVQAAIDAAGCSDMRGIMNGTLNTFLKDALSVVFTRQGIAAGNSPSNFIAAWESPDTNMEVEGLIGCCKDLLPSDFFKEKDGKMEALCRTWYEPSMQAKQTRMARREALDTFELLRKQKS